MEANDYPSYKCEKQCQIFDWKCSGFDITFHKNNRQESCVIYFYSPLDENIVIPRGFTYTIGNGIGPITHLNNRRDLESSMCFRNTGTF